MFFKFKGQAFRVLLTGAVKQFTMILMLCFKIKGKKLKSFPTRKGRDRSGCGGNRHINLL
jgi:hypothetical protein